MNVEVAEGASWLLFAGFPRRPRVDPRVIEGARRGDPSALDEIVRRHYDRVYNLAYRMLRQREDAEDATQEAFLKAFDSLAQLRDDAALGPWIGRIAVNLCMGRLRSRARRAETPQEPSFLEEAACGSEDWAALDLAGRVRDAVALLPPKYRLALVAFYLEGRSYAEAARVAGVPVLTLKTRLYRARRMLRDVLGDALAAKGESAP